MKPPRSGPPFLGRGVAHVRLARADYLERRPAEAMDFDLAMHEATIVGLPFYDAEQRIPRGLEMATWPEDLANWDERP